MFESFKTRAEAVSAEVHRFATGAEASKFLAQFLDEEGVAAEPGKWAVWATPQNEKILGIDPGELAAKRPGLTLDVTREGAAHAKVGISTVEWGLADTGTVVQDATDVGLRLVSTLPEIHVALLKTDRIVPDLADLLPRLTPESSRYIAFITGPSRTADIERVLTIGVHGPFRLVVLCVDGDTARPQAEGRPS